MCKSSTRPSKNYLFQKAEIKISRMSQNILLLAPEFAAQILKSGLEMHIIYEARVNKTNVVFP